MAAIDATAASAFKFSSKLTPFDAVHFLKPCNSTFPFSSSSSHNHLSLSTRRSKLKITILASSSSSSSYFATPLNPSTKLYVSGLSFRTTQEGLRNAFQVFGQLVEVNLVMDKFANRPRGFAFLRYETEEEAKKAIEGMHGKFLDGRVIFVEVARPRPDLRKTAY